MAATTANRTVDKPLWLETPLIYSPHISARLGCNVYLKLDVRPRTVSLTATTHFATRPSSSSAHTPSKDAGSHTSCSKPYALMARAHISSSPLAGTLGSLQRVPHTRWMPAVPFACRRARARLQLTF
ncbi:hypothetical protein OBBRIDRAFT_542039 [Obba rivulosa]|uniref:Uncharacterized protein n=1 Tax=Obba rivulosa TaxID=1052685 RepID=A0A8E2J6F7_9APHY|nr:hypothetical protein OBBRIDRAFT_542039 [Obba rivulosa]